MSDSHWLQDAEKIQRLAPTRVLFACVANSARSQLAEAIARYLAPTTVTVASAGSTPTQLHPLVAEVLAEIRLDVQGQVAKALTDVVTTRFDVAITLCDAEVCPVVAATHRFHWPLPDPAGVEPEAQVAAFRRVRDELWRRLFAIWPRQRQSPKHAK